MKKLSLLILTVAGAAFSLNASAQCNTTAWGQGSVPATVGTPVAGGPTVPTVPGAAARYAGRCSLRGASGSFVQDGSPNAEATYRTRFYVLTPASGNAKVFSARMGALPGTEVISVTYNGTAFVIADSGAGTHPAITAAAGRWYSIELNWAANAAMTYIVQGNGAAAPTTGTLSAVPGGAGANRVDAVQFGNVSGTATAVTVDDFVSRRSTAIGRLCVGNANAPADTTRSVLDILAVIGEINAVSVAPGHPDANEDGAVNVLDIIALIPVINSVNPACP